MLSSFGRSITDPRPEVPRGPGRGKPLAGHRVARDKTTGKPIPVFVPPPELTIPDDHEWPERTITHYKNYIHLTTKQVRTKTRDEILTELHLAAYVSQWKPDCLSEEALAEWNRVGEELYKQSKAGRSTIKRVYRAETRAAEEAAGIERKGPGRPRKVDVLPAEDAARVSELEDENSRLRAQLAAMEAKYAEAVAVAEEYETKYYMAASNQRRANQYATTAVNRAHKLTAELKALKK